LLPDLQMQLSKAAPRYEAISSVIGFSSKRIFQGLAAAVRIEHGLAPGAILDMLPRPC
jgi:hypothetical protein